MHKELLEESELFHLQGPNCRSLRRAHLQLNHLSRKASSLPSKSFESHEKSIWDMLHGLRLLSLYPTKEESHDQQLNSGYKLKSHSYIVYVLWPRAFTCEVVQFSAVMTCNVTLELSNFPAFFKQRYFFFFIFPHSPC